MRDSNCRSATGNRASVSISTTLYDRRALDCTSDRPLINSLNHLAYLTTSSARVRLTLCFDGGVERLVAILKECQGDFCKNARSPCNKRDPALVAWKWSLALQCLLLLGTRGSELIRRRVVQAGIIPVVATVLDNYLELAKDTREKRAPSIHICSDSAHRQEVLGFDRASYVETIRDTEGDLAEQNGMNNSGMSGISTASRRSEQENRDSEFTSQSLSVLDEIVEDTFGNPGLGVRSGSEVSDSTELRADDGNVDATQSGIDGGLGSRGADSESNAFSHFYHGDVLAPRDEDVIWSLEILAYVSKYAYLKPKFQMTHLVPCLSVRDSDLPPLRREPTTLDEDSMEGISPAATDCSEHIVNGMRRLEVAKELKFEDYDFESMDDMDSEHCTEIINVFQLVEKLTARRTPREIPYWAGIVMRNSCRKDETRGGIRQCANFNCGKWEEYPRQFAKCRQCKRTKYCSKKCQLESWAFHRYWCAPSFNASSSSHSTVSNSASDRPQSAGVQARAAAPIPEAPATLGANTAVSGLVASTQPLAGVAENTPVAASRGAGTQAHNGAEGFQMRSRLNTPNTHSRFGSQSHAEPNRGGRDRQQTQVSAPNVLGSGEIGAHQRQLSSEMLGQVGQQAAPEQWFSAAAL